MEFEILGLAIRNTAKNTNKKKIRETDQGIRNPSSTGKESGIQYLESGNPESKGAIHSTKYRPVRPGKEDHLKRWTSFFETFPVGPNRSIEFWTEISGNFG